MRYNKPQVTIDLEEYNDLQSKIASLSLPSEGDVLTELEYQEATGILLSKALRNPGLFQKLGAIDIGKYYAHIIATGEPSVSTLPTLLVKFKKKH